MMLKNTLCDISGTKIGHFTMANGDNQSGITLVIPVQDNLYKYPVVAAVHVINGFGKSAGLMQIEELGQLETPILFTNTLQVGKGLDALVQLCLDEYDEALLSVNPVVMECNDSYLNDIQDRWLTYAHLREAYAGASEVFQQGAVGAGRGMSCFQYKGGIGSASRTVQFDQGAYILGALVLTNFGRQADFIGARHAAEMEDQLADQGSCIILLGTDGPLDSRQLKRVAKRAVVGLSRLGGHIGHGSGEVVLAYSTANRIDREAVAVDQTIRFPEHHLDLFFRAAIEAVEEAVLNSMHHAETVEGIHGRKREKLPHQEDRQFE